MTNKNQFKNIWEKVKRNVTVMQLAMISPVLRHILTVYIRIPLLLKSETIKTITWNAVAMILPEDYPDKQNILEKEISRSIKKAYKKMEEAFINDLRLRGNVKLKKTLDVKFIDENGEEYDKEQEDEDRKWDDKLNDYVPPLRTLAKKIITYEETEYYIDYNRLNEITTEIDYEKLKEGVAQSPISHYKLIEEYTKRAKKSS